ncbi:upper zone of growth plate and cartilage matrix associated a [Chiloscyllium plagiosum]|uniref:upper zone of growth plate and cartilage matrix associated a n=1 Tax=Chiloscyllium plagiosum TaxID=36176 RepID=UPI001CB82C9E|nr:upper zone of growth plate and cartilage matrix associated a [Chiloscyllium plagiosum]
MEWKQFILLSCLGTIFILGILRESESAAVPMDKASKPGNQERMKRQVFVSEQDASNFFKRRAKRSPKSRAEIMAENRQRLAADERRKEYHEEQLNEWESFAEEEQDEQYERSHEKIESWRQWYYDGLYPSYLYNRYIY